MLSNKDKKEVSDDLKEYGMLDEELSNIIINQEIENKKEKELSKTILKDNPEISIILGI